MSSIKAAIFAMLALHAARGAGGRIHGSPEKDPLIAGFPLSSQERHDLIEFLKSLTDEAVLHDRRFANPW